MKTIKKSHIWATLAIAVLLVGMHVKGVTGSNEAPTIVNGFGSQIGATDVSTAANKAASFEARKIRTTNRGTVQTAFAVWRASFVTVAATTNTDPTDGITSSTFTVANSTFLLPNPNVFEVGSASEPILLKNLLIGGAFQVRVQIWDSRGATETVKGAIPVYDSYLSSGATVNFDRWLSSGVTARVSNGLDGRAPTATLQWDVTKQKVEDSGKVTTNR